MGGVFGLVLLVETYPSCSCVCSFVSSFLFFLGWFETLPIGYSNGPSLPLLLLTYFDRVEGRGLAPGASQGQSVINVIYSCHSSSC
ncbi:hypothetical protein B0F90DRAFT_1739544, partial [Multifurca ochricompacta]